MKLKLVFLLVLALLVMATMAPAMVAEPVDTGLAVRSLGMFSDSKWTVHYRAPNDEQIELLLEDKGISLAGPEARGHCHPDVPAGVGRA